MYKYDGLKVRAATNPAHGLGLFATRSFAKGQCVVGTSNTVRCQKVPRYAVDQVEQQMTDKLMKLGLPSDLVITLGNWIFIEEDQVATVISFLKWWKRLDGQAQDDQLVHAGWKSREAKTPKRMYEARSQKKQLRQAFSDFKMRQMLSTNPYMWYAMNHGPPYAGDPATDEANLVPRLRHHKAKVNGIEWVAKRNIKAGEELFYHYGQPDPTWAK